MGEFAAYVPADRRRAIAAGVELPDRTTGAVLFADVSGFTPLTAALVDEHGPREGAERLTGVLDTVLGALIDQVEATDGSVVYFSGDAITCWFDGDDGATAVACGDAMQAVMARAGQVPVGEQIVTLGVKVAVAVGAARRFVVGDPDLQRIDVLAGQLLDDVAACEGEASPGEVVITPPVAAALPESRVARAEHRAGGTVLRLPNRPEVEPFGSGGRPTPADLPNELAAEWVLPDVRDRIGSGDTSMVGELRRVCPVFLKFGGVDFDRDGAVELVDGFVTEVQRVMAAYGGTLLQLTVGDKGAYLYGVFGAPIAHEDDAARAVAACRSILDDPPMDVADLQIGISSGRVFSGTQGHPRRRTIVCLGDPVNRAARVMSKAGHGELLVTPRVLEDVRDLVDAVELPPVELKGIEEPVALARIDALRETSTRGAGNDRTPFVGRRDVHAQLRSALEAGAGGATSAVVVGDAGAGKTRLVREVLVDLEATGWRVVTGSARAFGRTAPYQPWHQVWRELLDLPEAGGDPALVAERVAEIDPALVPRAPLLGPVLGMSIPDSDVTRAMSSELRRASREDLLGRLYAAHADPATPLVVVLEDAHDADDLSLELVASLRKRADRPPGAIVLAGRPGSSTGAAAVDLASLDETDALVELEPLGEDAVDQLVDHHSRRHFGDEVVLHPRVRQLVVDRAQGNPLTVAELIRALDDEGVDPATREAAEVDLPGSLEALVLGRIDRLPDLTRRSVKVASVMLRPFNIDTLTEVHPELGEDAEVDAALRPLLGDVVVELEPGVITFRHTLTREVAYGSLPFTLRSRLHTRTGLRVERRHDGGLQPYHDVLAHHFWHGEDPDRRVRYQRLAGADAKAAYANEAALTYYARLVETLDKAERADVLLERAEVLTLMGRLDEAADDQTGALDVAVLTSDRALESRSCNGLAETARRHGRLDEAAELLDRAAAAAFDAGDDAARARSLHLAGTVAAMKGDLATAGPTYREALELRRSIGLTGEPIAALMTNLGIVAQHEGNPRVAAQRHQEAIEVRRTVGDPWAIANSMTNLGMAQLSLGEVEAARDSFQAALDGNREVGDPFHVALGHHNLGNALRDLGDYAAAVSELGTAGRWFAEQDDPYSLAMLFEDAAVLSARAGQPDMAAELVGAADHLRERIDTPRAGALAAEMSELLSSVEDVLGLDATREARERGRRWTRDASAGAMATLVADITTRYGEG